MKTKEDHEALNTSVIDIGLDVDQGKRIRERWGDRKRIDLMIPTRKNFEHDLFKIYHVQQQVIYECYCLSQTWTEEIVLAQVEQEYTEKADG